MSTQYGPKIAKKPGHKLLKDIVTRTLAEDGDYTRHRYALYKSYGIDFARDYFLDAGRNVKTVELPVDSIKRVALPDDYIDYVKIGVRTGDHILAFLRDDNIALFNDTECNDKQPNAPTAEAQSSVFPLDLNSTWFFHNYVNEWGEHLGGFYGHGNGRIRRGFKIDGDSIVLNSEVNSSKIYLEYISNDAIYSDEVYIPITAEQACKDYIRWQLTENDKNAGLGARQHKLRIYNLSMKQARRRKSKLSVEDIYFIMRDAYKLAPKQ